MCRQHNRLIAELSTLSLSQPLVEFRLRWERAAEVGMTAQELGYTVSALTDGAFVSEFFLDDDKINMYLYSKDGVKATLDSLDQKQIYPPVGAVLPFSAIADIVETVDTNNIRRLNGRRTVTLNIIPPDDVALETGVQRVREELVQYLRDTGEVPSSISMSISGASVDPLLY